MGQVGPTCCQSPIVVKCRPQLGPACCESSTIAKAQGVASIPPANERHRRDKSEEPLSKNSVSEQCTHFKSEVDQLRLQLEEKERELQAVLRDAETQATLLNELEKEVFQKSEALQGIKEIHTKVVEALQIPPDILVCLEDQTTTPPEDQFTTSPTDEFRISRTDSMTPFLEGRHRNLDNSELLEVEDEETCTSTIPEATPECEKAARKGAWSPRMAQLPSDKCRIQESYGFCSTKRKRADETPVLTTHNSQQLEEIKTAVVPMQRSQTFGTGSSSIASYGSLKRARSLHKAEEKVADRKAKVLKVLRVLASACKSICV